MTKRLKRGATFPKVLHQMALESGCRTAEQHEDRRKERGRQKYRRWLATTYYPGRA